VYVDCRKIIGFPRARTAVIDFAVQNIAENIGYEQIDAVAGGETAGIPYAAWLADRLGLPMLYVRKKPKGFGRNAQIEGHFKDGDRVLLVEDLASQGSSKITFINALREAGARCDHTLVVFFYAALTGSLQVLDDLNVTLHYLSTWKEVLEVADIESRIASADLAEVRSFLANPDAWSKAHGGP
jgi:orotate phosphoribosyltransferase